MKTPTIAHERGNYFVKREGKGLYRVYENGATAASCCATFHYSTDEGRALKRAVDKCDDLAQLAADAAEYKPSY